VQSLVCKEKELYFRKKQKTTPSDLRSATPQEGNFSVNLFYPFQWFLRWSELGYRQGKNNTIWVDFNPWNYLSGEKMVMDFFDTIDNRLAKIYGHGLGKKLNKYVNLLTSTVSPTFLGLAEKFGGWELGLNPAQQSKDLGSLKSEIEDKLRTIEEKIVIVIDDIDRLPPEMVLIILRLVGITANFPNIFFILAMDYDKIEAIVQKVLGEQYQNYLQKIVNERVGVPKWGYEELGEILDKNLKNFYSSDFLNKKIQRLVKGYGKLLLQKYYIWSFVKLAQEIEKKYEKNNEYQDIFPDFYKKEPGLVGSYRGNHSHLTDVISVAPLIRKEIKISDFDNVLAFADYIFDLKTFRKRMDVNTTIPYFFYQKQTMAKLENISGRNKKIVFGSNIMTGNQLESELSKPLFFIHL